jgi:hypothetical protein
MRGGWRSSRNSVWQMGTEGVGDVPNTACPVLQPRRLSCLTRMLECLGRFGDIEHISNALQVISHRSDANFDPRTGQTPHQQSCMPEDSIFYRREGMFDCASAQTHHLELCETPFGSKHPRTGVELGPAAKPVCNVISANIFRSR